jgi:predicted RND superfamily exporter protein
MRLSYTFKRTRKALELSLGTSFIAFFALGYTRLTAIKSFAWYAVTLILVNYVLTLVFLPPIFVWYEKKYLKKR